MDSLDLSEPIILRGPSSLYTTSPTVSAIIPLPNVEPPPLSFIRGTWFVMHSTLPTWRSARNIRITYTPLSSPSASADRGLSRTSSYNSYTSQETVDEEQWQGRLDDLVRYQKLDSNRVKEVRGVDTLVGRSSEDQIGGIWDWRGKGLLAVASARWEILGHGEEEQGSNQWMVTYFASTIFTPAGIDIYSRNPEGLNSKTVRAIKDKLGQLPTKELQDLVEGMFEIRVDSEWHTDAEVGEQEAREGTLR